ncbi:MAG: CoA transferase [Acidimicrobiia bacterium]|nr:CoA transferase [Acidimicrobiia bacterium]
MLMGPMDGVRVVEMGLWVAGPSCGGILADWGADVVKIEPLAGDPFRSIEWSYPDNVNPPFELDNRGKRSLALDIRDDRGLAVVHDLLAMADVFVTNYRPAGLERAGLDYSSLADRYPQLIYAQVTGYGLGGDERDRAAYDMGAFYSRGGIGAAITPDGNDMPYPRSGMGDHMTGLAAAAGVSAALFHRARTGEGQQVSTSLLRLGAYMYGWDQNVSARLDVDAEPVTRSQPPNPLLNGYRCCDNKWIWLLGLEADRHWPNVAAALGRPDWEHDPRFDSIEQRMKHSAELVAAMDEVIVTKAREEWAPILDRHGVWWAKVQSTLEMRSDPQAHAAGCYVKAPTAEGQMVDMVATPVDFGSTPWDVSGAAPELGQHTELVLMELGKDWDEIEHLKADGVIS